MIAAMFIFGEIGSSDNERMGLLETVMGIIFLLSIGYTEEIFSRGFVYGLSISLVEGVQSSSPL